MTDNLARLIHSFIL